MKYAVILTIIAAICLLSFRGNAQSEQEKLDLPGDNLNLYSVLKLFQESETLEGFEKNLNDESSRINNLDLNGDNKIDYIKVTDKQEDGVHNITLKVAVNEIEDQDVAVFVVKKEKEGGVQIQVIGDEDLYGKNYIIEPNYESTDDGSALTPNPGYTGNRNSAEVQNTTTTEISTWPVISYMYDPSYVNWNSPWYWNYYPSHWRPWRPFYWHYYYGYHYYWNYFYNSHYRRWHLYRQPGWYDHYYGSGSRSRSDYVRARVNRGEFNQTYTRPGLAKKGSAEFRKDYPKAPTVNNSLPAFDETGRPIVKRPESTRPLTRPAVTEPVTTGPPLTKPIPFPPAPGETKQVTKPVATRPEKKEPDINNPTIAKPVTAKPAENKPETKPVTTSPKVTDPVITRPPEKKPNTTSPPVIQPVAPKPPATNPDPARPPVTKPPNTNNSNKNGNE